MKFYYQKKKIEDAKHAGQASLEEGVVKGGGVALKEMNQKVTELTVNLGPTMLKGSVEELDAAMIELGNAGGLTDSVMKDIANRARELLADGKKLTTGLERVEHLDSIRNQTANFTIEQIKGLKVMYNLKIKQLEN